MPFSQTITKQFKEQNLTTLIGSKQKDTTTILSKFATANNTNLETGIHRKWASFRW